jgi:signal transduction histidine kinase
MNRIRETKISLPESVKILRATLNATNDGILVVNNNRHVLEANDIYYRMWNISSNINNMYENMGNFGCIKNKIKNFDNFEAWVNYIYGVSITEHYTLNLIDERIIDVFSTPLMDKSKAIGRVWSFRDVTNRRQNEDLRHKMDENLKLVRETFEYDKLKTEFFANISHEVKTPLNILIGTLKLFEINLNSQVSKESFENLKKYTAIMRQNCFRLLRMLGNLIYITEIDSGYVQLNIQNNDLVQIVKNIANAVERFIENKGVQFDISIELDSLEMACDADKIERILLNLLSNAVKFTKQGDKITVSLYRKNNFAYLSVKDTGIGIPDEMKEVIFQRFIQVDKSFTRKCEGSGIGLTLVKSLLEMHKGSIKVISEYGKGSEFIVILPIWRTAGNEIAASAEEAATVCRDRVSIEFSDIY